MENKKSNNMATVINALCCVIGSGKSIYLSTPMTNGPRLVQWMLKAGIVAPVPKEFLNLFREEVFIPNCMDGNIIAEKIRSTSGEIVIDPTRFDAEGWTQEEYLTLWCKVIELHCKEVCFNTGWEYSNGCVREYVTAIQSGIPVNDCSRKPIDAKKAIKMVARAIFDLEKVRLSTDKLREHVQQIQTYSE
ncbi:MAG: DUF4406 domain-containing protein [Desulfobulbus sp.]|nr:DUF4406 domain-containing protein [Desulfobulbus sp.]